MSLLLFSGRQGGSLWAWYEYETNGATMVVTAFSKVILFNRTRWMVGLLLWLWIARLHLSNVVEAELGTRLKIYTQVQLVNM
jgi:hypothetical protein